MPKALFAVQLQRAPLAAALAICVFGAAGCASTQAAKKPAAVAAVEPVKPRDEIVQSFEKQRDEAATNIPVNPLSRDTLQAASC